MKKISVIIPVYKVEKYLDRCLESVVNQTYSNLEIILVDDGSPDRCGELCDQWAEKDSRIKVIHKKNGGLGFARNSGLDVATGDYIAFVDSDDYLDVTMYEKLMKQAEATDSDIVFCGHIKELSNGEKIPVSDFKETKVFDKKYLLLLSQGFFKPSEFKQGLLTMSVWHAIYRRSIINCRFHSEREVCSEDISFQVETMLNSSKVSFIPDALYVYCYNGESLSNSYSIDKFERYKTLNRILNQIYEKYDIDSASDYCVFMMAFASIRKIVYFNIPYRDKLGVVKKITGDSFWRTDRVDTSKFALSKKMVYQMIKRNMGSALLWMAIFNRFISKTILKKERI